MHRVEPKPYLVGESALDDIEIQRFLKEAYGPIGQQWFVNNCMEEVDELVASDSEILAEVMGRLCYRSFAAGLNKNVTKIREGNDEYIGNLLKQKHGSVLEHGSTNWIIHNVSRVFTHELVRHRAGVAVSQESMRYVRLDDFGLWLPEDPAITEEIRLMCEKKFIEDEKFCTALGHALRIDAAGNDFAYKKKWTSFIRRFAPHGLATTIGFTINFRAMRHVIEMRTSEGAEVEIRLVFDMIARICKEKYPAIMQDMEPNEKGEWLPKNSKV